MKIIKVTKQKGNIELAMEESKEFVKTNDDSYLAHFLYGQIMWHTDDENKKDRTKCFTSFFKVIIVLYFFNQFVCLCLGQYFRFVIINIG